MRVLDLLPNFIIIIVVVLVTVIININFITFIIIKRFEQEQFTVLMRYVDRLFLFPSISSCVLTRSIQPPFRVGTIPRYYHLASFNCGDMMARDRSRIVHVI